MPRLSNVRRSAESLLVKYPWLGWAIWTLFCVVVMAGVHPRRFASTFLYYIDAAKRFVAHEQLYNSTIEGFLYLPSALVILSPFTRIDYLLAGAITLLVYIAVFTFGAAALVYRLADRYGAISNLAAAGLLLVINMPTAWYNFKGVQSQVIMTGAILAAAAAIVRAQWLWASFWLFVAVLFKPLAIVMVLLCFALVPRMRLPLAIAIVVIVALPFAFTDAPYMIEQYRDYFVKMSAISASSPDDWIYRADLMTLLYALGIRVPNNVAMVMRMLAALGALYLAWRVRREGSDRSFALLVVLLTGCFITLFSPRNEFLSFLVVAPSITALAFVLLARDQADPRGWLLVAAPLVLGFWWSLKIDAVIKPAIVLAVVVWVAVQVLRGYWTPMVEGAGKRITAA